MLHGRSAKGLLVAGVALAAAAPAAWAAGDVVKTTLSITPKHAKVKDAKKGKAVGLKYDVKITRADGSRPDNASSGTIHLPKGVFVSLAGLKACPLTTLQNNDVKSCPKNSVVGTGGGQLNAQPISDPPLDVDGITYYTGKSKGVPAFATYYTVRTIPSAHNIITMTFAKGAGQTVWRWDVPRLTIAPGVPDATVIEASWDFASKGFMRLSKPCKASATSNVVTFYDNPVVTESFTPSC